MTQQERIAYPIDEAFALIGVSRTRGYQLIATGELETYKHGKRRYATRERIEACVADIQRKGRGSAAA